MAFNINQRLNGLEPLAYAGANAVQPPDFVTKSRPPTANDSKNFYLGQIWLDTGTNTPPTSSDIYMLVSLVGNQATWVNFSGGAGTIQTLTGNTGGAVGPDGAFNINVVGDGTTISVAGNPGTHTLTISTVGTGVVNTLTGNSGGAVSPTAGNINVLGTGVITVVGNPGTSTLTVTPSGSIASSFITNPATGTATPAAGVLTFTNGNNITFTAGGSSVAAAVTGTTNRSLQLGNASGSLTSLGVATNGQLPIGSTGANPVLATLTAGAGISITNGAGSITIAQTVVAERPTFIYRLNREDNVSGDGTVHFMGSVTAMTSILDNTGGAFFPGNGAGLGAVFTAPIEGIYFFSMNPEVDIAVGGGNEYQLQFITSTRNPGVANLPTRNRVGNFFGINGGLVVSCSTTIELNVGDTVQFKFASFGGAKTDSLCVNSTTGITVNGYLLQPMTI